MTQDSAPARSDQGLESAFYDWASLMEWIGTLDPRTRTAILALTQEAIQRQDWVVPEEAYGDPFEIIGRLDGLSALMVEDSAAVSTLAGSAQAREDMVVLLTYLVPMWRMRMSWDMARLRPDASAPARPSSLLDAVINFPVAPPDESGPEKISGEEVDGGAGEAPEADGETTPPAAGEAGARKPATGETGEIEGMRRYLRILIGLVARLRLALDMVREERLDRVEAAVAAALVDRDAASPAVAGDGDRGDAAGR